MIFPVMHPSMPSVRINGQFVVHPPGLDVKSAVLIQLENHIARYTSRDLTYDSDALNAISAILKEFQLRGIEVLHGIPRWLNHTTRGPQKTCTIIIALLKVSAGSMGLAATIVPFAIGKNFPSSPGPAGLAAGHGFLRRQTNFIQVLQRSLNFSIRQVQENFLPLSYSEKT
jgi:hypothetical protein